MEPMTQMPDMADALVGRVVGARSNADRRGLTVGDIMSANVVIAHVDDTVFSAARKMSENNVSCVVVLDETRVRGILTEKDVLKGVARRDVDFRRLKVSDRMSSPAEVIGPAISVVEAGEIMEAEGIKRLPVVENGQLIGIVTQTDITRGMVSLTPLRSVCDIMTRTVATVYANATVSEAAGVMASNGISCVVAMHRGEVAGILTEKDLLKRVVALHKNPEQTRVADVMSFPMTTVGPDYSVLSASKKMETMHLHRLVIMDGKTVCGIVTQTDLMRAIHGELERLETEHRRLRSELSELVRRLIQDPENARDLVAELAKPSPAGCPAAKPANVSADP